QVALAVVPERVKACPDRRIAREQQSEVTVAAQVRDAGQQEGPALEPHGARQPEAPVAVAEERRDILLRVLGQDVRGAVSVEVREVEDAVRAGNGSRVDLVRRLEDEPALAEGDDDGARLAAGRGGTAPPPGP